MDVTIHNKRATSPANMLLYLVPLLDEFISAAFSLGVPLFYRSLHLSILEVGLLFAIGGVISMIVDPIVNILSERGSPRWLLLGSFGLMGGALMLVGWGRGFWPLLCLYALWHCLSGIQAGQAQRILVERDASTSVRIMTRWTLFAGIGDLLGPLCIPFIVLAFAGWQILFSGLGMLMLGCTFILLLQPASFWGRAGASPEQEAQEERRSLRDLLQLFKQALRNWSLIRWILIAMVAELLDELFVSFVTLYLVEGVHLESTQISFLLTAGMAASMGSLFLMERLSFWQKLSPITFLRLLALLVALGVSLFLISTQFWLMVVGMCVLNFGVAGWYPLAAGEAYRTMPEHTGVVRAVNNLCDPVMALIAGGVGAIAAGIGVFASVAVLCSAPLWVLLLCWQKQRT